MSRWLVLATASDAQGAPLLCDVSAYIAGPEDAICFGRNVWHASTTVFDQPAAMAMIMWRTEAGNDTEFVDLDQPLLVKIPEHI